MKKIFYYLMILLTGASSAIAAASPETGVRKGWKPPKTEVPVPSVNNTWETDPLFSCDRLTDNALFIPQKNMPQRILPKGEMLMGYCVRNNAEFHTGMNRLKFDGQSELLWSNPYSDYGYLLTVGYLRDNRLCSFFKLQIFSIEDYRYLEIDPYTGEILEDREVLLSDPKTDIYNYLPLYLSIAYDSDQDMLYGYTNNQSGNSYSFFKAPASEPDKPEAVIEKVDYSSVCVSICYNPKDKSLYGINRDNNFVKINHDGTQTVIMPIGKNTKYARAAMIYVPEEDCFLWNCQYSDGTTGLSSIDYINKQVSKLVDYQSEGDIPVLMAGNADKDPKAISSPIIDETDFGLGQNNGHISFFVPSALFNGTKIEGDVNYAVYLDNEVYTEGTEQPGKKVTINFQNIESGYHTFAFEASQGNLGSPLSETSLYIGYDTPRQPTNVVLTEERICWDKVSKGENSGYLDIDNLLYHVYLNGEEIGVTKEPEYVLEVPFDETPYCGYVAKVVAENSGLFSQESENSNMLTAGHPWNLDVHITPTRTEAQAFSAYDANKDGYTWSFITLPDGTTCMGDPALGSGGNDEWLFTPPLNLDDISSDYEAGIDIANRSEWYRNLSVSVYLCKELNPDSQILKLIDYKPKDGDRDFNRVSQIFSIPEPGTYYLAFYINSEPYQSGIRIKEIDIRKTGESISRPAEVVNLKGTGAPLGGLSAEIELELPCKFLSGEDIPADAELEVEIMSLSSLTLKGKPGEKLSVTIETQQGDNEITVTPFYNGNPGHKSTINVYCGQDIPGPVQNLSGKVSDDNLSLTISWEQPTNVGENGYYVDPDKVTYLVYQSTENGWEAISELGSDAREFTFTVLPDNGLKSEWIGIVPVSIAGESGSMPWMSDMLGTPYSLPADERFETGMPTYSPIRVIRVNDENGAAVWTMANPSQVHEMFANDSGICLAGSSDEDRITGRLMLPKFTTDGVSSAKIRLNIWAGMYMADVRILGEVNNSDELIDLGKIPAGNGWTDHIINLPESMQNRKWIALYIDAYYPTTNYFTFISNYSVYDGDSGVEIISDSWENRSITGTQGKIEIKGYPGADINIFSVDGHCVKSLHDVPDTFEIHIAKGMYIVNADGVSSKVIVR